MRKAIQQCLTGIYEMKYEVTKMAGDFHDVDPQDFMERPCDSRAWKKRHLTKKYLFHLKQSLMDLCHREHLNQVDLLTPAERNISEKEYWADRRSQKKN